HVAERRRIGIAGNGRDPAAEEAMQGGAGTVAILRVERMAGNAGAESLGARIACKLGKRIGFAFRDRAEMRAGFGVPLAHHAVRTAGQKRLAVGREGKRPYRLAGAIQIVEGCKAHRIENDDGTLDASGGKKLSVRRCSQRDDRHSGDLDFGPNRPVAVEYAYLPVGSADSETVVGQRNERVEGRGQDDMRRCFTRTARPEDHIVVVSGTHESAVGHESDSVDIPVMAFEYMRAAARERP